MLTRDETRRFYDAFGRKQDDQAWYEDPALADAIAHAAFGESTAVFEFGCGTGRLARRLFDDHLSSSTSYLGIDLSTTMVDLARQRLEPYAERAEIRLGDGSTATGTTRTGFDRFVSSYVLDLLPEVEVQAVLREARQMLKKDGLLVLVGLTRGQPGLPWVVSTLWSLIHRLRPRRVGGCRPMIVYDLLDPEAWEVLHRGTVVRRGLSSETLVARRI